MYLWYTIVGGTKSDNGAPSCAREHDVGASRIGCRSISVISVRASPTAFSASPVKQSMFPMRRAAPEERNADLCAHVLRTIAQGLPRARLKVGRSHLKIVGIRRIRQGAKM